MSESLRRQAAQLPDSPGVYVYRDAGGAVLYVGKAKSIRKRVRSYFSRTQPERIALLVRQIDSIETIVAGSEKEALLVESNLIKRHRPPFNVDLKDDKSYPYIRVTAQDAYPRLEITRRPEADGSLRFGPFTDVRSARRTLAYLERAFRLRRCAGPRPGGRSRPGRPCLDHQMGRCMGPCGGQVAVEEYRRGVEQVVAFFKGAGRSLATSLEKEMMGLSDALRFEEAAQARDRLLAFRSVLESQVAVGDPGDDIDILGFAQDGSRCLLVCLFVRSGLLVGRTELATRHAVTASEAFDAFIPEHYARGRHIPSRILCPVGLDFAPAHAEVLSELAGKPVRLVAPKRGRMARLIALARRNAEEALKTASLRAREAIDLTGELARALRLDAPPRRIECVDVSHIAGRQAYGSLVVWQDGDFKKDDYRLFGVSERAAGDDFSALEEVLVRRFTGSSSSALGQPDLLLVDGGKGQLNRALEVMTRHGLPVASLAAVSKAKAARRRGGRLTPDEIFLPSRANPVRLHHGSKALHLLARIRDEAHRFAITAHRRGRSEADLQSVLDGLPGIGPSRRRALLTRFRSVAEIRSASIGEIASVEGFSKKLAKAVKDGLG